jgi:membrane-associated phospholipid phosphatase
MRTRIQPNGFSRRNFLGWLTSGTSFGVATSLIGLPAKAASGIPESNDLEEDSSDSSHRENKAYQIRREAALDQKNAPSPGNLTNGDEGRYSNKIGSYSKTLPHNALGEVEVSSYVSLVRALASGEPSDFAAVPMGGTVKQANPQAAFAFEMEGADSHHLGMSAPPAFSSSEEAGEMTEVYWQALTRDIPFNDYDSNSSIAAAVADLSQFSSFSGINVGSLFRGTTPGDLIGPYISQFLWRNVPYGAMAITQTYRVPVVGDDHMTSYNSWLNIQNGVAAIAGNTIDPSVRYIRNGRDLAEYVHKDFSYQAFLNAALILLSFGGAALDDDNPYKSSINQSGFATFGGPHVLDLVAKVANCALKAAWYQKWSVHRRLRPEAFAGHLHNHKIAAASYPIHPKVLNSQAVAEVFSRFGTYLLPMAYPEGAPSHPSYPAGHACIAGACVTVLKAFFKESLTIPNSVVATSDGFALAPFVGPGLTVGGELNKLAANIAIGRDTAGVHWRSDGIEGLNLGEAVAISVLKDFKDCFNESFTGFTLTKFDGDTIVI